MAATGTLVMTPSRPAGSTDKMILRVDLAWVSDASGNVEQALDYDLNGVLMRVETVPDDTDVPTDNYDVTLETARGLDMLQGLAANRDDTNAEEFAPLVDENDEYEPVALAGAYILKVANAGNAKAGVVSLFIKQR